MRIGKRYISLDLLLVTLFLFEIAFLPGRYKSSLNDIFFPFPVDIVILLIITLILLISNFIKKRIFGYGRRMPPFPKSVAICIFIILFVDILSLWVNINISKRSLFSLSTHFILFYVPMLMMLITYGVVNCFDKLILLINIFLLFSFCAVIVSIMLAMSDSMFGLWDTQQWIFGFRAKRLVFPKLQITAFAALLSATIPISLSMGFWTKKKRYYAASIFYLIALLFTFARWNLLVVVVSLTLFFVLVAKYAKGTVNYQYARKMFYIFLLLVAGVVVRLWCSGELSMYTDPVRKDSYYYRLMALNNALSMFSERPILGYGPGEIYVRSSNIRTFDREYGKTTTDRDVLDISPYNLYLAMPHSSLLLHMVEGGAIGLGSFLVFMISLLRIQLRGLGLAKDNILIGIGISVSSFAYIFTLLGGHIEDQVYGTLLFWFVQGLALGGYKIFSEDRRQRQTSPQYSGS
jgi:O-antigen ligase